MSRKSRKPYPGMGEFVVLLNYSGTWVAHGGANSYERARQMRAKLRQWPSTQVKIVRNEP